MRPQLRRGAGGGRCGGGGRGGAAMAAARRVQLRGPLLLLLLLLLGAAGPGARAARSRGADRQNSLRRAASGLYQGVSGLFGEDNVRALQKVRCRSPPPLSPPVPSPRCSGGERAALRPQLRVPIARLGAGPAVASSATSGALLWGEKREARLAANRGKIAAKGLNKGGVRWGGGRAEIRSGCRAEHPVLVGPAELARKQACIPLCLLSSGWDKFCRIDL